MTPKQFRDIQAALGWTHAETARELGLSEVSVKRIATGKQVITDQTARALVGMLLIHGEGLTKKFSKLLDTYHDDTKMNVD
ncbi:helix-turn-helix domain-containing protein [Pandoraea cepalis]|uniref:helix-turn-helix domain-containing protein n=1 Tax=Pandoraea cepalis TaxID=2508294 RepID=UPI00263B917B|nr:helix-turn-helix transcriptional regulator [Pandoraea cepalis]